MAWETILFTTLALSTDIMFAIKGNSVYQPGNITTYGLSLTTNPVGYARLYTQYRRSIVQSSTMTMQAWLSNGTISAGVHTTAPQALPHRIGIVPADSTNTGTYIGGNVASIGGYPHGKSAFVPPGTAKVVSSTCNNGLLLFGTSGTKVDAESVSTQNTALTASDPSSIWYFVGGVTNASGVLNASDCQVRIKVVYRVKFFDPVAAAVMLAKDAFGNEVSAASSAASTTMGLTAGSQASNTRTENKGESSSLKTGAGAGVVRLTQAEAFEDWGDVDSEFASFKEQCALRRKVLRAEGKAGLTPAAAGSKAAGCTTA